MSVSDGQKKARDKWDKENMSVLGCKVKKSQAIRFKAIAAERGTTANGLLKDFVLDTIGETDDRERDNGEQLENDLNTTKNDPE